MKTNKFSTARSLLVCKASLSFPAVFPLQAKQVKPEEQHLHWYYQVINIEL